MLYKETLQLLKQAAGYNQSARGIPQREPGQGVQVGSKNKRLTPLPDPATWSHSTRAQWSKPQTVAKPPQVQIQQTNNIPTAATQNYQHIRPTILNKQPKITQAQAAMNDIMDQDNLYRALNKIDYRQKTVPTRSTLQFSNPYLPIDGYSNTIPNNIG